MDDFDFDASAEVDEKDLKEIDNQFLKTIQDKTIDVTVDDNNDTFTFWFLIILLLLFIFLFVMCIVWVVRGRRRRNAYRLIGYMK